MLIKEEIEKAKEDLMFFNEGDYITREMDKSADVLEEYIKQLEKENNKQNKIIDEMAEQLAGMTVWDIEKDEPRFLGDTEEVRQYFEKKVEGK